MLDLKPSTEEAKRTAEQNCLGWCPGIHDPRPGINDPDELTLKGLHVEPGAVVYVCFNHPMRSLPLGRVPAQAPARRPAGPPCRPPVGSRGSALLGKL